MRRRKRKLQRTKQNINLVYAIMGGGGILILVLIAMIINSLIPRRPQYEVIPGGRYDRIEYLDESRFLVETGNSWGVLDEFRREIIPFGKYGADKTILGDYIFTSYDEKYILIDKNGREVSAFATLAERENYDRIEPISPTRFIISQGGLRGVIDRRGRDIIPTGRYTEILSSDGEWYYVNDGNRRGLADSNGREIVSPGKYDIFNLAHNNRFIVLIIAEDGTSRTAVINHRGQEIISIGKYNFIVPVPESDLFIVRESGNWGVIDHRDREIIPLQYERIDAAGNTGFIITDENGLGVLNQRGEEIFPTGRYDAIQYVGDGLFHVQRGELTERQSAIISQRDEEIIPFGRYDSIEYIEGERLFIVGLGDLWEMNVGVVDIRGNIIIPMNRYDTIHGVFGDFAIVSKDGNKSVINTRRIN